MGLREFLQVLRRRVAIIISLVLLGAILSIAYSLTATKEYQSQAQLFVSTPPSGGSSAQDLAQGNTFTQDRVQSYVSVATSPSVTGPVVARLQLPFSADRLATMIAADAPVNRVLINITVTDSDRARSALIANAVAVEFSQVVESLEATSSSASAVRLAVIHPAIVPTTQASPNIPVIVTLGTVLGLIAGVGTAVLRDVLDNTVKDGAFLQERHDLPLLASIAWDRRATLQPVALRDNPHSLRSEAYRQLRTNLEFVDVDNPPKIISLLSASPAEGKSHSAINLAAALAESGHRVCLIDSDLRKPTIARALGLVPSIGLTSVLVGSLPLSEAMQNAGKNLAVLASGPIPPNPSELLSSVHFRDVLSDIADAVHYVVIDTAPLLPVSDGLVVASRSDACLLVVRSGKTTRESISRSLSNLGGVGVRPVGGILSMVRTKSRASYAYYYGGETKTPVVPEAD